MKIRSLTLAVAVLTLASCKEPAKETPSPAASASAPVTASATAPASAPAAGLAASASAPAAKHSETCEVEIFGKVIFPPKLPKGKKFKVYVDKTSHLVVKLDYRGKSIQGSPVDQEEFLHNYKTVGAVKLPHKTVIHQDGKLFLQSETSKLSLTDVIPADKFAKAES